MIEEDIIRSIEVLNSGGVILYPTDTIWGIGCDATNPEAVQRVYNIKKRDDKKSMLVLMNNMNRISSYVDQVPDIVFDIIELANKPTTIIYSGARNLAENLIAEDGTIGIRVTKEKFTDKLIERFKKPIVSTSANISGELFPKSFDDISYEIKDQVDYIVEYNRDKVNSTASSIIKIGINNEVKVIRE